MGGFSVSFQYHVYYMGYMGLLFVLFFCIFATDDLFNGCVGVLEHHGTACSLSLCFSPFPI